MGIVNKKFTEREKAALYMHVFGGVTNWTELYKIASDKSTEDVENDKLPNVQASRWKATKKVQEFVEKLQREKYKLLEAERQKIRAEFERGESERPENAPEGKKSVFVDYSDPANQKRKLNELINKASDPGEALDALKVIISGQRDDKQAAKERRQVAAYLPICCNDCPLYQKARKRAEKAL